MFEPVGMRRAAVVSGLLAAVCVGALFLAHPVPNWMIASFGGPGTSIERYGGLRVRFQAPPDAWPAFAQQLPRVAVERDGDALLLEFVGVTEDAGAQVFDVLEGGGLTLHEVRDGGSRPPLAEGGDVRADVDAWHGEDGIRRAREYLAAPTRRSLERGVAAAIEGGWHIAADSTIGYERLDVLDDPPYWRTYVLANEVLLDGAMIASATGLNDPETGRPIVVAALTPEGSERFCAVTRRLVGSKLALVAGSRVHAAPVINAPICDGRILFTMSFGQRDTNAMVAALGIGVLPAGGRVLHHEWVPPTDVRAKEWAGRLLLGLAAGLAFGVCVLLVLRVVRPSRPVREAAWVGRFPRRRLVVTLLGPIALFVGRDISLPGVNVVQFTHLGGDARSMNIVALGITPLLTAFIIVEIVALLVPRLRWRRHDPRGRAGLDKAAAVLALALAALHAYVLASYVEGMARAGEQILAVPGLKFRLLVVLTLATATMLLALLAGVIRSHGLGNGYGVLLVSGVLIDPAPTLSILNYQESVIYNTGHLIGGVTAIAIAIGTAFVLRWRITPHDRIPALRVPSSGVQPAHMFALVFVISFVATHGITLGHIPEPTSHVGWQLAVLAIAVPIWAWLFARPSLVADLAVEAGLDAPSRATWLRAAVASALLLIAAYAMWLLAAGAHRSGAWPAQPATVMLCAAVVLDIAADARARRRKLAAVAMIHQIQRAGVIERVLADAGIPCHLHASHLRTLLAFFGPWAPVIVLVPEEHAADARARIAGVTHPAPSVFS